MTTPSPVPNENIAYKIELLRMKIIVYSTREYDKEFLNKGLDNFKFQKEKPEFKFIKVNTL